jgi:hypothetical protein
MFKAPKYSRLLDPKEIPEGYLRKLFDPCRVTEHDFFLAVTEAHRSYQRAKDKWCRRVKKGTLTRGTPAKELLEGEIEVAGDNVLWLIGGLLGRYDEVSNACALTRMQKMLKASRKRSQREGRAARSKPKRQISSGGLRVPIFQGNAANRL